MRKESEPWRFSDRSLELLDSIASRVEPDDPALGEPLVEGLPYLRAEAIFAVRHEMATTLVDVLTRVIEANAGDPMTFFEMTTAAAFLAFAETPADVVLLEVGDQDVGALAGQGQRDVASHTRPDPRDDNDLPLQQIHTSPP